MVSLAPNARKRFDPMKTISQVLHLAMRSLGEKYHRGNTSTPAGEAPSPPAGPPAPRVGQADRQREVLRRFMHLPG
jgi:hypothetical protein